jgi:hypothetical protein
MTSPDDCSTGSAPSCGRRSGFMVLMVTTASGSAVAGVKASFLFASEDGVIRGWSSATQTQVGAELSASGAIYKGLAISASPDRLFAADLHNARVDVFDGSFNLVSGPVEYLPDRGLQGDMRVADNRSERHRSGAEADA